MSQHTFVFNEHLPNFDRNSQQRQRRTSSAASHAGYAHCRVCLPPPGLRTRVLADEPDVVSLCTNLASKAHVAWLIPSYPCIPCQAFPWQDIAPPTDVNFCSTASRNPNQNYTLHTATAISLQVAKRAQGQARHDLTLHSSCKEKPLLSRALPKAARNSATIHCLACCG